MVAGMQAGATNVAVVASDFEFTPLVPTPVQSYQPAPRSGIFKAVRNALVGPNARRAPIEPRKGSSGNDLGIYGQRSKSMVQGDSSVVFRGGLTGVAGYNLGTLARRDDVIFSIRNTLQRAIGEMDWKIVPDIEHIKADLKRLSQITKLRLQYPGLPLDFTPQAISPQFYFEMMGELRMLIQDEFGDNLSNPDGQTFDPETNQRFRTFFQNMVEYHECIAEGHIEMVRRSLDKPNQSAESSFRGLLNRIIDDLTTYDSAAVIKNPRIDGTPGELYCIPGDEVRVYQCYNLSTPQPPYTAYDWFEASKIRATYNNDELIYLAMNPQKSGYGLSPIEVVIEQMVGSLYGDASLVDQFQNSNIPPFVFDLGPNVSQAERDAVEEMWDNRVRKGSYRGIFIGAKEGVKGFIPLQINSNKDQDTLQLMTFWAKRKCSVYGLNLGDIGFTEDLHRTTAETQGNLSQARGVVSMAKCIEGFLNQEYVKGKFWLRDEPENPLCETGHSETCFPFNDVKFEFVTQESQEQLEDAQRATSLIDAGVLTRNEVRKELGLPPRAGGDILTISAAISSIMTVEDLPHLDEKQQAASAQQGPPGADGKPKALPGGGTAPGSDDSPTVNAPKPPGSEDRSTKIPKPNGEVDKALGLQKLTDELARFIVKD